MRTSIGSSFWKQVRSAVIGPAAIVPLAASAVLLAATGAAGAGTTTIASTLGAAGPANSVGGFGVLALGGAPTAGLTCTSTTFIGNVGVGGPGKFSNSSCNNQGNVYLASTVTKSGKGTITGKTIIDNALLRQAVSDAQSASSTFAGMAATDTKVTSVKGGNQTFTATQAGINVVDLSSLSLSSKSLTFSCGSFTGCQWVVNDAGTFQLNSGSVTLGSGMTSGDVLFNVYSHGASISFQSDTVNGIFLAPYSSWTIKSGTWNGEVIGGLNGTLTLNSGTITAPIPVTEVPISGPTGAIVALILIGSGLTAAQWYSRRRVAPGVRASGPLGGLPAAARCSRPPLPRPAPRQPARPVPC
jgi:choice-of-anchor A domain-containing protein